MSAHTPGPLAKLCGCKLEPVDDGRDECDLCSEATGTNDGTGWVIEYCALHAAAPALLEALEEMTGMAERNNYHGMGLACDRARAALRAARETCLPPLHIPGCEHRGETA